jgi:hypothetical protein
MPDGTPSVPAELATRFAPTLPSIAAQDPVRLYLAESVAAAIEVKSDLSAQWAEAQATAAQLAPLRRNIGATITFGDLPLSRAIPDACYRVTDRAAGSSPWGIA